MTEPAVANGRRRALVIASQVGLHGCHNDAALVQDLLAERGFDVMRIQQADASRAGILGAYEELIQATQPHDAAVVYFSGHGSRTTTKTAGVPSELRFILPTDIHDTNPDDFRGILADELSVLQWRLTMRTSNVTTILDCCYSSRMARAGADDDIRARGWDTHWPVRAVVGRWSTTAAEFRGLRMEYPDADWLDGNPRAVRLVACGSHQRAFEGYSAEFDACHGLFTAALVPVLRSDPHTTWQSAGERVRDELLAAHPIQRPEAEGPTDRVVFTTDVRPAGRALPVRMEPNSGHAWLDGAQIHGIGVGDEFLLSEVGRAPDVTAAPVVRVTQVVVNAAMLEPVNGRPIPDRAAAHTWRRADRGLGVRVIAADGTAADGTAADAVLAGLRGLSGLDVRSGDGRRSGADIATVTVRSGMYMLRDATGLAMYSAARAVDTLEIARLRTHVQQLANALRLRSLGDADRTDLPTPVDLIVSTGDGLVVDGDVLHLTDRLRVSVANTGKTAGTVYANVLDLGVAGRIAILNYAEPSGITLDRDERRAIGEEPGGYDPGMPFIWPAGIPTDTPRYETLVAIFSDHPQDFRGLAQEGVRGRSSVGDELARLLGSGVREVGIRLGSVRYAIRRVTFALCPGGVACDHHTSASQP